jgi:hypothetical protein
LELNEILTLHTKYKFNAYEYGFTDISNRFPIEFFNNDLEAELTFCKLGSPDSTVVTIYFYSVKYTLLERFGGKILIASYNQNKQEASSPLLVKLNDIVTIRTYYNQ